jgi:hypothetical protein
MPGGAIVIPSKYGGFFTYVEFASHAYVQSLARRAIFTDVALEHVGILRLEESAFTLRNTSSRTSFWRRLMSRKNTGHPAADGFVRQVEIHPAASKVPRRRVAGGEMLNRVCGLTRPRS